MSDCPQANNWEAMLTDPSLRLSPFEIACARLHAQGLDPEAILQEVYAAELADLEDAKPRARKEALFQMTRRIKWAVERAEARVSRAYLSRQDARESDATALHAAICNRKSFGRAASPLIGLDPRFGVENIEDWREYLRALDEPGNYREVSLRSPLVPAPRRPPLRVEVTLREVYRELGAPVG